MNITKELFIKVKMEKNTQGVVFSPPLRWFINYFLNVRKLLVIIFLLFLGFGFPIKSVFGVEMCQEVTLNRTTITNEVRNGLTDTLIYPVDKEIEISVKPKSYNPVNEYLLYAYIGEENNLSQRGLIVQGYNKVLVAKKEGEYLKFTISRDVYWSIINIGIGGNIERPLIPTTDNLRSWVEQEDIHFGIIEINPEYIRAGEDNIDAILSSIDISNSKCVFSLTFTNQCSQYKDENANKFTPYIAPAGFGMTFPLNSIVPSSLNKTDFTFSLRKATDNSILYKNQPVSDISLTSVKIFDLRSVDAPQFFNQVGRIELKYKNYGVCQTPFHPFNPNFDQKINQCKIEIEKDDSGRFANKIKVTSIPDEILDYYKLRFVQVPSSIYPIPNYLASPELIVIPNEEYEKIEQNSSGYPKINIIPNEVDNNKLGCTVNTVTDVRRCNQITTNNNTKTIDDQEVTIDPPIEEGVLYHVGIYYDVRDTRINKLPLPFIRYHIPTCHAKFSSEGGVPTIYPTNTPAPTHPPGPSLTPTPRPRSEICNPIDTKKDNGKEKKDCINCIDSNGVWTAFGCINTNVSGLIDDFFKIGLGLAGGVALLFFIYGGFLVLTSQGNAEQIQQGREIITSAIAGLLLIIFSVFILQLFAVDILKIPGFSKNYCNIAGGECDNDCSKDKFDGSVISRYQSRKISCPKENGQQSFCCQLIEK